MVPDVVIAGRFELLAQAGKGSMGSVYRALDRSTGQQVAVKVLTLSKPQDIMRFGREAELLAVVRHPHVVGYVAHGTTDEGIHYLVQEWVEGITLREHIRRVGVDARDAVEIATGISLALAAAHAHGVMHRDVKPENIILTDSNPARVKLVDFGIARTSEEATRLTRTGVMVGTPTYMSPEQSRGEVNLGPELDVWAIGCVLYELLAGRPPFAGPTSLAIRAKVLLNRPALLNSYCPEAPDALVGLVDRLLSKVATDRPVDGSDVVRRLQALPPMPTGPKRRGPSGDLVTRVPITTDPETGNDNATSVPGTAPTEGAPAVFVFLTACDVSTDTVTDHGGLVNETAARHGLSAHFLEDGSAVLAGPAGAMSVRGAANAAMELAARLPNAAVSVSAGDSSALDRGAEAVERAAMGALFADVVDGAVGAVYVDRAVANAVSGEIDVDEVDEALVLRQRR